MEALIFTNVFESNSCSLFW